MSLKIEIAELMDKTGTMYDVAEKVEYKQNLTSEEKEILKFQMHGAGRLERLEMTKTTRLPHL